MTACHERRMSVWMDGLREGGKGRGNMIDVDRWAYGGVWIGG